jgi:hypothetical protein
MMSAVMPTPGALAKQGTLVYKLYNKFDDSGKCASMLTKLVHGRCFVAGDAQKVSGTVFGRLASFLHFFSVFLAIFRQPWTS